MSEREASDLTSDSAEAWLACLEFIKAPPLHLVPLVPSVPPPPPPFFCLPLPSRGLQPLTYARARASASGRGRAIIFLSTCGFSFVSVPLSLSLRPHPSKEPLSTQAGHGRGRRERGGTSGLRRSKNEMRLKERRRPSSLPPSFPASLARSLDEEEWEY